MRLAPRLTACLLLVAACTTTTEPAPDQFQSTAPPFGQDEMPPSTVTTVEWTTTATPEIASGPIRGALPDGTIFDVYLEPHVIQRVNGTFAGIIIELDDGRSPVAATTTFHGGSIVANEWVSNSYRMGAGNSSVSVQVYQHIIDHLGEGFRSVFETGIRGTSVNGFPVLELSPPFRWASDDEIPLQMEVMFETFVVRRGCGDLAVACSPTHAVQVIPLEAVVAPAPSWGGQQASIESPISRPVSDPHFLDPGPLSPRGQHDVIWTGEEMIVWGGANGARTAHLVEGAAFNPETNEWRTLPPPPIASEQATRAVWADEELVVISPEATLAYRPDSDDWVDVGFGIAPAGDRGMTVATEDFVYTWMTFGISQFDRVRGVWWQLPDPGFGGDGGDEGALRVLDDTLYAIGHDAACPGRKISEWTGIEWRPLPEVSLVNDCSTANQTAVAGGRLIIWEDELHPTMAYDPDTGVWQEIARIPVSGVEGPPGPMPMDEGFLVPHGDQAVMYHSSTGEWHEVDLPIPNSPSDMAWTGEEVLMWGGACCYGSTRFTTQDAWRWTPPP